MRKRSIVEKTKRIDGILADTHGGKKQVNFRDPTEELILTVLSQNTNDTNRDRAFVSLKKKYPNWRDVAGARPAGIARAIKAGGLANIKSKRIIKILKQIGEKSAD